MSFTAFALIFTAALIHAIWNLIAKKSGGGSLFVVSYTFLATIIYLPVAVWLVYQGHLPQTLASWSVILLSSFIHLAYTLLLQKGYQKADLSVVYPVARGTAPLISATGAYLLFKEPATALSITGLFIIVGGIGVISKIDQIIYKRDLSLLKGIKYGLMIGICIAMYTLTDAFAIKQTGVHPLLLDYISNVVRTLILLPTAWNKRIQLKKVFRDSWKHSAAIGLLGTLGYTLVLYAIQFTPVSLAAPAREMSMMMAALLGYFWLKEGDATRRFLGAGCIVAGVLCLAFSGH
ncbi:MAG: DMT family transporter [Pseudomonadota bacterium]